jgi:hypothetical protein
MKPIILITSCWRDAERRCNDASRETWLAKWGDLIPHKFVLGRGRNPKDDELVFDVDDSYESVPYKLKEAYRWVIQNNYDFVFQCDVDTFVCIPRLLESDFKDYNYVGHCYNYYAQGGAGFWLSSKAVQAHIYDVEPIPTWSDVWTGDVMKRAGIALAHDERYWPWGARSENLSNIITVHLSKHQGNYDPSWMFWQYDRLIESMR